MQAQVVTRISINASAAQVFKYLAHLKYHYLWNPQIQSISSERPLSRGTRYKTTSVILGVKVQSHNIVTKFVQREELEISNHTGLVQYVAHFKLHNKTDCTVLTCTTKVASESEAFAFAKPVLKLLARRELQTDMQALKLAVEHQLR